MRQDERLIEALSTIARYCSSTDDCDGCIFEDMCFSLDSDMCYEAIRHIAIIKRRDKCQTKLRMGCVV